MTGLIVVVVVVVMVMMMMRRRMMMSILTSASAFCSYFHYFPSSTPSLTIPYSNRRR